MRSGTQVVWAVVLSCASVAVAGCGGDNSVGGGEDAGLDSPTSYQDVTVPPTDTGAGADTNVPGSDTGIRDTSTGGDTGAISDTSTGDTSTADGGDGGTTVLNGPSNGSAVAISPDDSVAVVVNRDVGSVTVLKIANPSGGTPTLTPVGEVPVGGEPWQVVISPDSTTAYVVLRKDQKVVKVTGLQGTPAAGTSVAVGSEPTAIALTPTGASAWVANWVDGTLSEVDTAGMTIKSTVDLNAALVATGYLGTPHLQTIALAHPRSIAITNNLDAVDTDESLYVTEFFAQTTAPELANGSNADTHKTGLVYRVKLVDKSVTTITLAPLTNMWAGQTPPVTDDKGGVAGCFPNQLQAIAINTHFAYVTSVCESPKGPTGPKVTATACTPATVATACAALVDPVCVALSATQPNPVCVDLASVKTTSAPVVSVIDTTANAEIAGGPVSLNNKFLTLYRGANTPDNASRRFPLVPNDLAFVAAAKVGYVAASGSDAVFRVVFDLNGNATTVGSSFNSFIDLVPAGLPPALAGHNPVGIAITHGGSLAVVASDVTRVATLITLASQSIAAPPGDGGIALASVVATSALPTAAADISALNGKRFFNTGLARWSLRGQAWGACQVCHIDGLSDNVTWYFARGPRQSTSLDGTFNKADPTDQRILNWTAINDELTDFEGNVRGISGGVGAIVSANSVPPAVTDRIDVQTACATPPCTNGNGNLGLNGTAAGAANPANPLGLTAPSVNSNWADITTFVSRIRSPRAATGLDPAQVSAGAQLFASTAATLGGVSYQPGVCTGCHSGPKWTISKVFYPPSGPNNIALLTKSWSPPAGFPAALLPATVTADQNMRFTGGNPAAFDQILCTLRSVGTFNVAETGAGIAELRIDMTTAAQGNGIANGSGKGYNVPALLGVGVGAPYFHGGNARTLEALFDRATFATHARALSTNFLLEANVDAAVKAVIQYLLSIDNSTPAIVTPPPGNTGGDFCVFP